MLGIYTRLSREDVKSASIQNQKREGIEFAKNKNFKSYHIYNEGEGVSGTLDLDNRPQLFELISDIKKGVITAVWMRNQNRLDRNTATFYLFVTAIKKADIPVYFADGDAIDFNDPATLLQTSIVSSLNQYTAQLQSKQTKKALRDNAKEGKAWGVIPYGYTTDENKYIMVEEKQAETVKDIFELSLKGWGVRRIATHLTAKGIPTKYNGYEGEMRNVNKYDKSVKKKNYKDIVWSPKSVLDILKNKWYIGQRTYAGVEYPTPPIIDEVLFNEVGQNLVKNRNNSGKKVEYRYLLKGLLRCGRCERNYYGRTRKNKNDNFYMCSSKRIPADNCGNKSISIPYLETFIINHLFKTKNLLNHLQSLEARDTSIDELKKELDQVTAKLVEETKKAERLAELLINNELGNDQLFIDKYNKAKTNISTFKARINSIEQSIKERSNNDRIKTYKENMEVVDLNNFSQLKQAINDIIETIEISSFKDKNDMDFYDIEIKYRGYNETTIFQTWQPYHDWIYCGSYLQMVDEDNQPYSKEEQTDYTDFLNQVYLCKEDLIHFN